eukprot:scaffold2012_cov193-Cylindrotheca_fusiformis.AAC.11
MEDPMHSCQSMETGLSVGQRDIQTGGMFGDRSIWTRIHKNALVRGASVGDKRRNFQKWLFVRPHRTMLQHRLGWIAVVLDNEKPTRSYPA